jgi:hypothetical protein
MFEKVAYVYKSSPGIKKTEKNRLGVGISALPPALGCDRVYWGNTILSKNKLNKYDLFLVNVFPQSKHVKQLRGMFPNKIIVAMPDPHLEKFLRKKQDIQRIVEFKYANLIGARTKVAAKLYSSLTGVDSIWMPSPIGPTSKFEAYRTQYTQKDFILSVDHKCEPTRTMQNIAALAEILRRVDIRIILVNPQKFSRKLAKELELNIEFKDFLPYASFLRFIAQAKIGVDMYAAHSQHRHALTHAMVGTPLVSSSWSNCVGHLACDPFDSKRAGELAMRLFENQDYYTKIRNRGFAHIDKHYSYEACRQRVRNIMQRFNL